MATVVAKNSSETRSGRGTLARMFVTPARMWSELRGLTGLPDGPFEIQINECFVSVERFRVFEGVKGGDETCKEIFMVGDLFRDRRGLRCWRGLQCGRLST